MKTNEIHIRDPFVFANEGDKSYYMFGTTAMQLREGESPGFDGYKSVDMCEWEGPIAAFRPCPQFWATRNYWAAEVYYYTDKYYMFASFKADKRYRGTQILVSDSVQGPYQPLTDGPITPPNWECLDGTLFVDPDGTPWIVFCHEWVQVHNGGMWALRLTKNLKTSDGPPHFLFNASEAPWIQQRGWPTESARHLFPTYVTDGPFLYNTASGRLLMLWSSFGEKGYALGIARSETGLITGPWKQDSIPLWAEDGGHGMIFRSFDNRLFLTFHRPNKSLLERPVFIEIDEVDGAIMLKK